MAQGMTFHPLCLSYGSWPPGHGLRPSRWLGADCSALAVERRKFRRHTHSIVWVFQLANFKEKSEQWPGNYEYEEVVCIFRGFFSRMCGSVVDRMKGGRRGGKVELCSESRVGRDAFQLSPDWEGGSSNSYIHTTGTFLFPSLYRTLINVTKI